MPERRYGGTKKGTGLICRINFQVTKEAKLIRFNLHIDGKHYAEKIFIGAENQHPQKDPFELVANPVK